jgi:hypothetical protein
MRHQDVVVLTFIEDQTSIKEIYLQSEDSC